MRNDGPEGLYQSMCYHVASSMLGRLLGADRLQPAIPHVTDIRDDTADMSSPCPPRYEIIHKCPTDPRTCAIWANYRFIELFHDLPIMTNDYLEGNADISSKNLQVMSVHHSPVLCFQKI